MAQNNPLVMVTLNHRFKNEKKGITPVIATIILIAGTLVLALVVGAYTFGIFGSNVKSITVTASTSLNGGTLTAAGAQGTANLDLYLQNPGSSTYISSITITGGGLAAAPSVFVCTGAAACVTPLPANTIVVASGTDQFNQPTGASPYANNAFYFSLAITSGNTYAYTVVFANGQSVSGSLIAQ